MKALVVALFLSSTLVGCASSARYMIEVRPPQRISATPETAVVIFVRPSKMAFAISANIIDEQGRYVGDIPAKGHFAVAVPPGPHTFVVWAENTDALRASLAPGRIYFVEVSASMGAFSAHMHLSAIKPGRRSWMDKDAWIAGTTQYAVDQQGGQANLYRRGPEPVQERLRRGQEHLSRYAPAELDEHTLNPGDGL